MEATQSRLFKLHKLFISQGEFTTASAIYKLLCTGTIRVTVFDSNWLYFVVPLLPGVSFIEDQYHSKTITYVRRKAKA